MERISYQTINILLRGALGEKSKSMDSMHAKDHMFQRNNITNFKNQKKRNVLKSNTNKYIFPRHLLICRPHRDSNNSKQEESHEKMEFADKQI